MRAVTHLDVTRADIETIDEWLAALDARKTVHAYLGEVGDLAVVLDELEPLGRRAGDLGLLQWCVFESSFPHLAAGRWAAADELMAEAIRVNTRSGYAGYHAWFEAHRGWLARMAGRLDDALTIGERTAAMESAAAELKGAGRTPYVIPIGASTPLGAAAFVDAIGELGAQIDPLLTSARRRCHHSAIDHCAGI